MKGLLEDARDRVRPKKKTARELAKKKEEIRLRDLKELQRQRDQAAVIARHFRGLTGRYIFPARWKCVKAQHQLQQSGRGPAYDSFQTKIEGRDFKAVLQSYSTESYREVAFYLRSDGRWQRVRNINEIGRILAGEER